MPTYIKATTPTTPTPTKPTKLVAIAKGRGQGHGGHGGHGGQGHATTPAAPTAPRLPLAVLEALEAQGKRIHLAKQYVGTRLPYTTSWAYLLSQTYTAAQRQPQAHNPGEQHQAMAVRLAIETGYAVWQAQAQAQAQATMPTPTPTPTSSPRLTTDELGLPALADWQRMPAKAKLVAIQFVIASLPTLYGNILHKVAKVPRPGYPGQYLTLDPDQLYAVLLFLSGKSFVLTGAAGTGKTLVEQALSLAYVEFKLATAGHVPGYWYKMPVKRRQTEAANTYEWAPAHFVGAFTNKAAGVLRSKILANPALRAAGYGPNLGTIHGLLEFVPVKVWSELKQAEVLRYFPQRTASKPLADLQCIIIDEASNVGVGRDNDLGTCQLWTYLYDAIEEGTQVVLVGDLNQLPPVGGKSILSYAVSQLPICELTFFHRQATESPIIAGAHNILTGALPVEATNPTTGDSLAVRFWKPELAKSMTYPHLVYKYIERGLDHWIARGEYDPEQDVFLIPMFKENNKHILEKERKEAKRQYELAHETGIVNKRAARKRYTAEQDYVSARTVNRVIGTYLARKEGKLVYCIQAGYERHYLAIGDRVLLNGEEGAIVDIEVNPDYSGASYPRPSYTMDYWGKRTGADRSSECANEDAGEDDELDLGHGSADIDTMLASLARTTARMVQAEAKEDDPLTRAASHIVSVDLADGSSQLRLSSAGHFSNQVFQLGWALTVHKSQGSEWRNVFVLLHPTHNKMLSRELIYTAVTRAQHRVFLLGSANSYQRGIANPRIKGDSLAEKVAWFSQGNIERIDLSKLSQ